MTHSHRDFFIASVLTTVLVVTAAFAQNTSSTDPVFWCDLSRSQVSHERDAALAQIETLKYRNASLETRIKELEAKPKERAKPDE